MTGSDNSNSDSRPISVAELLAKNGTIGSPPVGGRRRRRRGNSDSVTVAELTGEIPIIAVGATPPAPQAPAVVPPEEPVAAAAQSNGAVDPGDERAAEAEADAEPEADTDGDSEFDTDAEVEAEADAKPEAEVETDAEPELNGEPEADAEPEAEAEPESDVEDDAEPEDDVESDTEPDADADAEPESDVEDDAEPEPVTAEDDDYADAVADYTAHIEARDAEPEPLTLQPRRPLRRKSTAAGAAEEMSPDAVIDDAGDALDGAIDIEEPEVDYADDSVGDVDADELPSYLRSSQEPLFGGETVADDLARRGGEQGSEDLDEDDDEDDLDDDAEAAPASKMSTLLHGASVVGQCVIAVAFGAGLFVAFDQLWKWNNIVALVLSVLVILGLVVGVRVVRKTEDIGSTLIAVAVGALVTLGPLALLQSG